MKTGNQKKHAPQSVLGYYIAIVICCCGFSAVTLGICNTVDGVFFSAVAEKLHVSRGAVSVYATISNLMAGIGAPLAVRCLQKISVKQLALFGGIAASFATLLMAYADKIWLYYVLAIFRGLGCACISSVIVTLILGNWFYEKRGLITGVVMSFSGVAGAICSPVFSLLLTKFGYDTARAVSALVILILTVPMTAVALRLDPKEVGIVPLGAKNMEACQLKAGDAEAALLRFRSILFLLVLGFALSANSIVALNAHLPGYAETIGFGTTVGVSTISFAMMGNISSKFILGFLCDRIGVFFALFSIAATNLVALVVLLLQPGNTYVLLGASFAFGFVFSIGSVGTPMMVRKVYGDRQYGKAYGTVSFISAFFSATAISLVGILYDVTGSYQPAIAVFIAVNLVAIACNFFIMGKKGKRGRRRIPR